MKKIVWYKVEGTTVTETTTLLGNANSTVVGSSVVNGQQIPNANTMGTIAEGTVDGTGVEPPIVSNSKHDLVEKKTEETCGKCALSSGCPAWMLLVSFLDLAGGVCLLVSAFYWRGQGLKKLLDELLPYQRSAAGGIPAVLRAIYNETSIPRLSSKMWDKIKYALAELPHEIGDDG